jgi:hypothetical protein
VEAIADQLVSALGRLRAVLDTGELQGRKTVVRL